ncbi:hypothetical protein GGR56DRAFT_696438 [Xylariaceae sp. FL0804]|nr:hypothetical protein GGR56DRAFT_696438 [Xylariaceae sp. FL0804]
MPGNQNLAEGDYFPFARELSSPAGASAGSDTAKSTPKQKRSITPRGPIFSDLSEAHRKITARSASNAPLPEGSSATSLTSRNINKAERRSQDDLELPNSFYAPRESLISTSPQTVHLRNPFLDPDQDMAQAASKLPEPNENEERDPPRTSARKNDDKSASTVEKIYDQYAGSDHEHPSSLLGSSGLLYTFSGTHNILGFDPFNREGAATACGFRGEELRTPQPRSHHKRTREACTPEQNNQTDQPANSKALNLLFGDSYISQPPKRSLPQIPPGQGTQSFSEQLEFDHGDTSQGPDSSLTDSQKLLGVGTEGDQAQDSRLDLVPAPLRIPSSREHPTQETEQSVHNYGPDEFFSDAESIENEHMTQAGEDPFEYDDRGRATRLRPVIEPAWMRPGMERDISQALRRASRPEVPSQGTLFSHDGSPCDISQMSNVVPGENMSPTGNLRVKIDRLPLAGQPGNRDHRTAHNLVHDPEHDSIALQRAGTRLPREETDNRDWVTESTSEVGFGGIAPMESPYSPGVKATGSSIADYSDCGDGHRLAGPFGSREPILQHPAGESKPEGYEVKRLKDTKQRVFLPRRTNRFPENSTRLCSTTAKPEATTDHPVFAAGSKPLNPFGQGSFRRADARGDFTQGLRRNGPSKYDFRDSISDYTPAASNEATCGTRATDTYASLPKPEEYLPHDTDAQFDRSVEINAERNPSSRFSALRDMVTPRREPKISQLAERRGKGPSQMVIDDHGRKQFATTTAFTLEEEPRTPFNLPCELLPLDLAQKRNKMQRESGETDETATAKAYSVPSPLSPPRPAHPGTRQIYIFGDFQNELQDTPTPRGAYLRDEQSPASTGTISIIPMGTHAALHSPDSPVTNYSESPIVPRHGWLKRFQRKRGAQQKTNREGNRDANREAIADTGRETNEQQHPDSTLREHMEHNPIPGFVSPEEYISDQARSRRQCWFYMMAILSILPFFAILVLTGVFNDSLAWFTQGEVYRLTAKQRKFIKCMFLAECIVYTAVIVAIIVYFITKGATSS